MLVKVTAGILILATVLGLRLWWSLDSAEPPTAPPSTRASDRGMPATAPAPAPPADMPTPEFVNRWRASDTPDPAAHEEALAVWHIAVKDPDEHKVGRAFSNAVAELALSSTPEALRELALELVPFVEQR